jgi:hypothetical protein
MNGEGNNREGILIDEIISADWPNIGPNKLSFGFSLGYCNHHLPPSVFTIILADWTHINVAFSSIFVRTIQCGEGGNVPIHLWEKCELNE